MRFQLTVLLSLALIFVSFGQANQLSPNAQISVLTIGPGASLNDAFGHNAFRINDRSVGMDIVYGYGEYDFDTPNFYLKFAQGKLKYQMSKHSFSDFYHTYAYYNRTIREQVLNLTSTEKQQVLEALQLNYKPENRKYLYDFFYDNCATRIRDVAVNAIERPVAFAPPADFKAKTFRQLIHDHTGRNNWGSFGIDIALGSVIDREATPYEHMYLPNYIHDFFATATLDGSQKLTGESTVIFKRLEIPTKNNFLTSPLMLFSILAIFIIILTYNDYKKGTRSKWLDVMLFSLTGLTGIVVLLLWFATDHTATANNYNILWAFPLNIVVIGQLLKTNPKQWFKKYLKLLLILMTLLTLHWIIGVQIFAIGLIPLLLALIIRYVYLIKVLKR